MSGTTNGAVAPDDGSGIPADLLADTPETPEVSAEPTAEDRARQAEQEAKELRDRVQAQEDMLRQIHARSQRQDDVLAQVLRTTKAVDDRSREAQERGWQFAHDEAWAAIDRATENADKDALARAKHNLALVMRNQPAPADAADPQGQQGKQQQQQVDPEVKAWVAANPWFDTDLELRTNAMVVYDELEKAKPNQSYRDRLAETRARVIKRFPDKFPTQVPRAAAPTVARPGPQAAAGKPKPKAKTIADLPDDAKQALARIKRRDASFTDEDYLKSYKWDN